MERLGQNCFGRSFWDRTKHVSQEVFTLTVTLVFGKVDSLLRADGVFESDVFIIKCACRAGDSSIRDCFSLGPLISCRTAENG